VERTEDFTGTPRNRACAARAAASPSGAHGPGGDAMRRARPQAQEASD